MPLKTRRPTGAVPWPLILVEGAEKAGKTFAAAVLTTSDKVGRCLWIDLGEGAADEYGAIPGADYEIVEHDGSWGDLFAAVREIEAIGQKALDAGEKPVVLIIDTMTAEWEQLKDWATHRAKGSKANRAKLAKDPNAEIVVSQNYWNDANARHRQLMAVLKRFPGIVVMTAHGKYVSAIGENGQPIEGQKEYRVEGQKTLGADASCWVRLSRDARPMVVGARSVHTGIRPGIDDPKPLPEDWTLEWLIFEALKCDPRQAHVRDLVAPKQERTPEEIRDEAVRPATSVARLGDLFQEAEKLGYGSAIVPNERDHEEILPDLLRRLGTERRNAGQAAARLGKLWAEAEITDPADQLAYATETVGRDVTSLDELTAAEGKRLVERLARFVASQAGPPEPETTPEPEAPPAEQDNPPAEATNQPAAADAPSAQEIADEAMNTEDPDTLGALQSLADKAGKLGDTVTVGGKSGQLGTLLNRRLQIAKARVTQRENEQQKNEAAA